MKPMKKNDMITTITRECWKQWAHLEALKVEIAGTLDHDSYSFYELTNLVEADEGYKGALSVWYGMSELADKVGIDWLNAGYSTDDEETIEARRAHEIHNIHFWRMCKNPT